MGHIVNPISFRLYNIRYWNNNWFVFNKLSYSYIFTQDILFTNFFKKFFSILYLNSVKVGVIFVNLKLIRIVNTLSIYVYIHDGFLDLLLFDLDKLFKYARIRKLMRKHFMKFYYKAAKKSVLAGLKWPKKRKVFTKIRYRVAKAHSKKCVYFLAKAHLLTAFWNTVRSLVLPILKRFTSNTILNMHIIGLSKRNVNANIISEYLYIRLAQYYTIWEILRSVNFLFRLLMRRRKKIIRGYKIICSGRFSRKQRATYSWRVFGGLASSSVKAKLDYSYRTIALKYSACTLKVWVSLRRRIRLVDFVI